MCGGEPFEKIAGIDPQRARAVPSFLHHQNGDPQVADQLAVELEVIPGQRPRARGIPLGGVQAERHDQKIRCELRDVPQGGRQGLAVSVAVDCFRQGQVQVEPGALARADFIPKSGKIG